jgi:hypothetical protein
VPIIDAADTADGCEELRHVVALVDLEQWVDEDLWFKAYPHSKKVSDFRYPKIKVKPASFVPTILRDMEHDVFNKTFHRNDQTWVDFFEQNKRPGHRGRRGVQLRLALFHSKTVKKSDLQATIFLSQSEASPFDPLGEYAPTIYLKSSSDLQLSFWVKDTRGQIFASPYERYDSSSKKRVKRSVPKKGAGLEGSIKLVEFKALKGNLAK